MGDYVIVPREATGPEIAAAIAFAQKVSLSSDYDWYRYMRELRRLLISAAPVSGMVAVDREDAAWMAEIAKELASAHIMVVTLKDRPVIKALATRLTSALESGQ